MRLETQRLHQWASNAFKMGIWVVFTERFDEVGAEYVARGFAYHHRKYRRVRHLANNTAGRVLDRI